MVNMIVCPKCGQVKPECRKGKCYSCYTGIEPSTTPRKTTFEQRIKIYILYEDHGESIPETIDNMNRTKKVDDMDMTDHHVRYCLIDEGMIRN